MSTYSFKVTKGKYELSLSTADKDFIIEEFEKWVRKASAYVQKRKSSEGKDRVNAQINAEKEITQRKIEEQLKKMPKAEPIEEAPVTEKPNNVSVKADKDDLDVFYAPKQQSEPKTINNENTGFDSVLDRSMNNPQTELSFKPSPAIKKDNAFLNYIEGRKITRKIDYLLLTAYYFTQFEQKPRFTLKQLNAKLMQNLAVILDHSVVQEAINRDYIECLPDLTGVVGASEYRLTAYGEKTLLEEG